ncbi:MAG: hypothetical protein QM579_12535 [Desulfovibrio sp.]|uniref:hypothetical protein n=1 Tax=Desulfovibrio sp. TaxID=885 RepID=UPI0039E5E7EF
MNSRKIREDLGRARASSARRDPARALYLTISALKDLGGQPAPTDLRGDLRTTIVALTGDPDLKDYLPAGLGYQPGNEKDLLQTLVNAYQNVKGSAEQEDYETTLQRKLSIDRNLRDGKKLLSEGRASEADACFAEAMKSYKDELAIFAMMATAMINAGEYVRALGHVRNGLKEAPQNAELIHLANECIRLRSLN